MTGRVKPMIFSGPMVRALIAGRKTMTRRVLKPQPPEEPTKVGGKRWGWVEGRLWYCGVKIPYAPGDLLWVREVWAPIEFNPEPEDVWYKADGRAPPSTAKLHRWRPSIHMPRWASRLTLAVQAVKIERLQNISEEDARKEGARPAFTRTTQPDWPVCSRPRYHWGFEELWESIHGAGAWEANPFVAALTFAVHRCNVDQWIANQ